MRVATIEGYAWVVTQRLPQVMHTHVGYLLVRLGKRAQRAFESSLVPLGLRPPHFDVLAVLAEQGRLSQKEVAEVLGVDSARVVALADELGALGAVERAPDPADRRRNLLVITDSGHDLFERARSLADGVQAELTANLGETEVADVRAALQRLL